MQSKSQQAALAAQNLASGRSWANDFMPTSSQTGTTPSRDAVSQVPGNKIPSGDPPAYEDVTGNGPAELPGSNPELNEPVELVGTGIRASAEVSAPSVSGTESTEPTFSTDHLDPLRCYRRHVPHGHITGVFTVLDYLELSTDHGTINITLDPKPGDQPIVLRLTATFGAVQVRLSEAYLQQLTATGRITRPWDVRIRAKRAGVDVKLPIGQGSKYFLKSRWSEVISTFYVADSEQTGALSQVEVETHRGRQKIKFMSLQGTSPINNIGGDYHAKTGGEIKVTYPNTWQGRIHTKSERGKVKIEGDNLQTQSYGAREMQASRGLGQGTTVVRCDGHGKAKVKC